MFVNDEFPTSLTAERIAQLLLNLERQIIFCLKDKDKESICYLLTHLITYLAYQHSNALCSTRLDYMLTRMNTHLANLHPNVI